MNTLDELIEVLQGIKAGRKWGFRTESGLTRDYTNQSFEELMGMLPTYTIVLMPETITCNGVEISAPLRVALEAGKTYYIASPSSSDLYKVDRWTGHGLDRMMLDRGLIHATAEAAVAHGRAMCGAPI